MKLEIQMTDADSGARGCGLVSNLPATPLIRLADPRRAPPSGGQCAHWGCGAPATMWLRTGVQEASRLRLAALSCDKHEDAVRSALRTYTPALAAAHVPLSRCRLRARSAASTANRLAAKAAGNRRLSACLAGASSLTHTYGLLSGVAGEEARSLGEFAAALLLRVARREEVGK